MSPELAPCSDPEAPCSDPLGPGGTGAPPRGDPVKDSDGRRANIAHGHTAQCWGRTSCSNEMTYCYCAEAPAL